MSDWNSDIGAAPFQTVVLVRNDQMREPVRATRGYTHNGMVHPDTTFFTSVYTPHQHFPVQAGLLVCPTEWKHLEDGDSR